MATVALACDDGAVVTRGLEEPLSIEGAQFASGALPGAPPESPPLAPRPTAATTEVTYLEPRRAGVPFFGWATLDAVAVGARFEGIGTGYWVVPAGPPDPQVQGEPVRTWRFTADFHDALPPGRHRLLVAAIDAEGRAGSQVAASVCIQRLVPDNGNVCDPKKAPPELVVSLAWDRPVDLDLVVITPDSRPISAKSPSVNVPEDGGVSRRGGGTAAPSAGVGVGYLDRDSNADCHVDGRQIENIVFAEKPAPGSYLVYVNLHDACGEPSVSYTVTRHVRSGVEAEPGAFGVAEVEKKSGSLVAVQANGSAGVGTFVTEFFVP
jgi:hypothetical protein